MTTVKKKTLNDFNITGNLPYIMNITNHEINNAIVKKLLIKYLLEIS